MDFEKDARIIEAFLSIEGVALPRDGIEPLLRRPSTELDDDVGEVRRYRTGYGAFAITLRDNIYEYVAPPLNEQPAPLSNTEAQEIASAFAARHVAQLERRFRLERAEHAGPTSIFAWGQARLDGEVSIYSNTVVAVVDGKAHRVRKLQCSDLDFVRRTQPQLSRATAEARILELSGGRAVEQLDISEVPLDHATRAVSVWSGYVWKEGGTAGLMREMVSIDADTGALFRDPSPS
jgi:hypothetical protein